MDHINAITAVEAKSANTPMKEMNFGIEPVILDMTPSFAVAVFEAPNEMPTIYCATRPAWEFISLDFSGFKNFCREFPSPLATWNAVPERSIQVSRTSVPGIHPRTYMYKLTSQNSESSKGSAKLSKTDGLSEREQEVVKLMAQGLGNREIARSLDISYHTVRAHLRNIFATLNVSNRIQAVHLYREKQ